MFRTLYWYFSFVVTLIGQTPYLLKSKKFLKSGNIKEYDDYVYGTSTKWALKRIEQSGAEIIIHNEELIPKDKNVLFISNHQGYFDIAIFMALIKKQVSFVSKIELTYFPLLSHWMSAIHCLFMDRNNIKQSAKTIIEGINLLKKGYSLVIFPEGTRSKGNFVREFKAGSFKLATKSKIPIIPVTLNGTYKILEANNYFIRPAKVDVYIHEPIYTENLSKEEINELPEKVKEIIESKITA